jgi:hypothetical protein
MQPIGSAIIHQRCPPLRAITATRTIAETSIIVVAIHFARRLTAPCASQSRIAGPKRACACRRRWSRSEPRAAAHAAISTKTVVGITGRNAPTTPRPRLT